MTKKAVKARSPKQKPLPVDRICVLVLGMHRSGTSALTKVLSLMGAALPKRLMLAAVGNEAGHWEPERLVEYNENLVTELGSAWHDWHRLDTTRLSTERQNKIRQDYAKIIADDYDGADLFVVKDPRICRFPKLFTESIRGVGIAPVVVLQLRNPLEVVDSLQKRSVFWPETHTSADAALLWLAHILEAEHATRDLPRTIVTYEALLRDWRTQIDLISRDLGISFPFSIEETAPLIDEFLTDDLRHHSRKPHEVALSPELGSWISEAFDAMLMLSSSKHSSRATEILDRIRHEFWRTEPILSRYAAAIRAIHGTAAVEKTNLTEQIAVAEGDAARLKAKLEDLSGERDRLNLAMDEIRKKQSQQEDALGQVGAAIGLDRSAQMETILAAIHRKDEEWVNLRQLKADAEKDVAKLEAALNARNTEFGTLNNRLSQHVKAKDDLLQQLEMARSEAKQVRQERNRFEEMLDHIRASLGAVPGDNRSAEQLIQTLKEKFETAKEELTVALGSVESMQAQLENSRNREQAKSEELAAAQRELTIALGGAEVLRADFADIQIREQGKSEELAEAKRQLDELGHGLKTRTEEMERATTLLEDVHRSYRSSTSWKLTYPIRAIKRIPLAIFGRIASVGNAVRFGGGVMPTVGKTLRVYRREGLSGVMWRYRFINGDSELPPLPASVRRNAESSQARADAHNVGDATSETEEALFPIANIQRTILESQVPLEARIRAWRRPEREIAQPASKFEQSLNAFLSRSSRGVVISVTHDNYGEVVGGVQFCVQLEERAFVRDGYLYLNLHPAQPLPSLSSEEEPEKYIFNVLANGEFIGSVNAQDLSEILLGISKSGMKIQCIIHALLGHSPEVIGEILNKINISRLIFWVHDFFSICTNHILLRNDIVFCDAPPLKSNSCRICLYGVERQSHRSRIQQFFEGRTVDVVAPAQTTLDYWLTHAGLRHRSAKVLPHSTLKDLQSLAPEERVSPKTPVRVAFLGYPVMHKGWPVFVQLGERLSKDDRYEFHHLGQSGEKAPSIQSTAVQTTAGNPDAMVRAIVDQKIDVVILWSICRETFSFTAHEALAGGALIVTNPASGNIQAVVRQWGEGFVLDNEHKLLKLFSGDELVDAVDARRSKGRLVRATAYSSLSRDFVR